MPCNKRQKTELEAELVKAQKQKLNHEYYCINSSPAVTNHSLSVIPGSLVGVVKIDMALDAVTASCLSNELLTWMTTKFNENQHVCNLGQQLRHECNDATLEGREV